MVKKRHILIVTHAGGSPHHGPNMRWYYLAKALEKHNFEVEIVSASYFHKYFSPPEVVDDITTCDIDGITYHWIKSPSYHGSLSRLINQLCFTWRSFWSARQLANIDIDFVIASSPHPFVVFSARRIALFSGAEFIFEVRDLWPEILFDVSNFSKYNPYVLALSFAERFGVSKSKRVISVKPGDGAYFRQKYNLLEANFSYIPNGFLPGMRTDSAPDEVIELRNKYKFVLGYTGAVSKVYNLDELIKLAKRFDHKDNFAIAIVGKGDQVEELVERARTEKLDNMYFLGPIANTAIPDVLSHFDACYVGLQNMKINKYGISSNKIFEYMHAQKPIIASYNIEYDPIVAADCGFVIEPGDTDAFEDAIRRLMKCPELCTKLGANARKYFEDNHNFSSVAKKLVDEVFQPTTRLK